MFGGQHGICPFEDVDRSSGDRVGCKLVKPQLDFPGVGATGVGRLPLGRSGGGAFFLTAACSGDTPIVKVTGRLVGGGGGGFLGASVVAGPLPLGSADGAAGEAVEPNIAAYWALRRAAIPGDSGSLSVGQAVEWLEQSCRHRRQRRPGRCARALLRCRRYLHRKGRMISKSNRFREEGSRSESIVLQVASRALVVGFGALGCCKRLACWEMLGGV